jgi:hypothetical protein
VTYGHDRIVALPTVNLMQKRVIWRVDWISSAERIPLISVEPDRDQYEPSHLAFHGTNLVRFFPSLDLIPQLAQAFGALENSEVVVEMR